MNTVSATVTAYDDSRYHCRHEIEAMYEDIVFSHETFRPIFEADVRSANTFVYVQSPYLALRAIERASPILYDLVSRGVLVCVFVRKPFGWNSNSPNERVEALRVCMKTLESMGVHVNLRERAHEKVVVIDARILWDGSLNFLSFDPETTSDRITRFPHVFKAMAAIATHSLDSCAICIALREAAPKEAVGLTLQTDSVGPALETIRKSMGFSQREIAQLTNAARTNLNQIELGKTLPRIDTLISICEALDHNVALVPSQAIPFLQQYLRIMPRSSRRRQPEAGQSSDRD